MELKRLGTGRTGFYRDLDTARKAKEKEAWRLTRVVVSPGLLEKEFNITEMPPKGREITFYGIPIEVERRWEGVCYKIVWEESGN